MKGHGAAPLTYEELTAGLVWPRLFRALGMAAQPPRLLLGLLTSVAIVLLSRLFDAFQQRAGDPLIGAMLVEGVEDGARSWARGIVDLTLPERVVASFVGVIDWLLHAASDPFGLAVYVLAFGLVWAIGGGAISRSAAVDVASDLNMSGGSALGFALRRWRNLTFSLLLPVVLLWLTAMAIRLAGFVLFFLPGVDVIGGLLYGLLLALGFSLALLFVAGMLAHVMLVPAAAAEGADAWDAAQRSYAYVLSRPGRFVLYAAVLVVVGLVALSIAEWLLVLCARWTEGLAFSWLGESRVAAIFGVDAEPPNLAGRLVGFWNGLLGFVLAGFGVSYYFCASTVLYLLMRRVCDDQDIREIWMPGMVGGTITSAERSA